MRQKCCRYFYIFFMTGIIFACQRHNIVVANMNAEGSKSVDNGDLVNFSPLGSPCHLFAGAPIKIEMQAGTFLLPKKLKFIEKDNLSLNSELKNFIEESVCIEDSNKEIELECSLWKDSENNALLNGNEAYFLEILPDKIFLKGRTTDGILRGLATLALLTRWTKSSSNPSVLECMYIKDAPAIAFRGYLLNFPFSVSPKRALEFLKRQVDILYLLKYNAVFFSLRPYETPSPFPFEICPDIGQNATTKQDWLEFANYIRERGMKPIPLLNIWDSADYILRHEKYKDLAVRPDLKVSTRSLKTGKVATARNVDVFNPMAKELASSLLGEVIDTMKINDIHIGMDELHYDDIINPKETTKKPSDFMIEAIDFTNKYVQSKKAQLYIWADMLDPEQHGQDIDLSGRELLEKLPHDVVLMDWKYGPQWNCAKSLNLFNKNGFRTVGVSWHSAQNVYKMVKAVKECSAYGYCGTPWSSTMPDREWEDENKKTTLPLISIEIATSMSLGAYFSWSNATMNVNEIPFIPMLLYQQAAYNHSIYNNLTKQPQLFEAGELSLCEGDELKQILHCPFDLDSIIGSDSIVCGPIKFKPFLGGHNRTAALVNKGDSPLVLKIDKQVESLYFLQTLSKPSTDISMREGKRVPIIKVGEYSIEYQDGTRISKELFHESEMVSWNNLNLPLFGEQGIYSLSKSGSVNIATLKWKNPYPDKIIKNLEIHGVTNSDFKMAIFAITLL